MLLNFFWLRKYQKVPRAYESLNPALSDSKKQFDDKAGSTQKKF